MSTQGPIFIGGPDRCGKTTMQAFLVTHPRLSIPDVGSNMWTYFYGQYGALSKPDNFERCLQDLLSYKHVLYLQPDVDRIRAEFATGPKTYGHLFSLFHLHFAERANKPRWGVQTGLIERYASQVFAAYPDARIIHMIRDPRDRYQASLKLWPDGKGRAGGAVARWRYSLWLARRNLRNFPTQYKVVRFEELVRQPARILKEVCDFIGEEYTPAMLSMSGSPKRRAKLVKDRNVPTEASPLDERYIGHYQQHVPKQEIAFIQNFAGSSMKRLGYQHDTIQFSNRERADYLLVDVPKNCIRLLGWLAVELLQQHAPRWFGRTPDKRMIVRGAGFDGDGQLESEDSEIQTEAA